MENIRFDKQRGSELKSFSSKKPAKDERERNVLLALVELYLETGRPVGSQTLKECGFDSLSPATLRNYFAKLEEGGFLKQQHSSGGRIPTNLGYKTYAEAVSQEVHLEEKERSRLIKLLSKETREVHIYLERAAEIISELTKGAVFLSYPRFDQDLLLDIKLVGIDRHRVLCALITDFGTIRCETLFTEKKLSAFNIKRIEQFFRWKITNLDKPNLEPEEEMIAGKFYNEILLRHIVNHSSFSSSDLLKTGFSQMLQYPDFNDASSLASGLSLFENDSALRSLLSIPSDPSRVNCWIGDDLDLFSKGASSCSVLAIPYVLQGTPVGSIGVLCPRRAPYKKLFATLKAAAEIVGFSLTKSLYKFKITYRQPSPESLPYGRHTKLIGAEAPPPFTEDKINNKNNREG